MCVVNVSLQHRWDTVCAYLVHLIKNGVVNVWLQHRSDRWEKVVAHLVSFEHVQSQQHVHRLLFQDGERRLQERVADLYLTCAATTAGWNTRLLQHPANSHHNIYAANHHTYYYYWFSINHSVFHSRLITFLLCTSFPQQPFLFFLSTDYMDSTDFYCYILLLLLLLSISVFTF